MNTKELYDILDNIFIRYTTHQWKNGWENEENKSWCNLFLLQWNNRGFSLDGPNGFKIELQSNTSLTNKGKFYKVRIDIESKQMGDIDIYYYVDNESDWKASQYFIIELCQRVYDINCKLKEALLIVPDNIYGVVNPNFTKLYHRDNLLNELGI